MRLHQGSRHDGSQGAPFQPIDQAGRRGMRRHRDRNRGCLASSTRAEQYNTVEAITIHRIWRAETDEYQVVANAVSRCSRRSRNTTGHLPNRSEAPVYYYHDITLDRSEEIRGQGDRVKRTAVRRLDSPQYRFRKKTRKRSVRAGPAALRFIPGESATAGGEPTRRTSEGHRARIERAVRHANQTPWSPVALARRPC
jgi:hypothetical protein